MSEGGRDMWSDMESLRSLSHGLMWATALCGVLAAMATGIRYYVDRRVSELASAKRAVEIEQKDAAQRDREAQLQAKVDAAEIAQKEADLKLSKVEAGAAPRNLDAGQRQRFIEAISACQNKRVFLLTAPMGVPEPMAFAQLIESLFKAAGWTSHGISQAVFSGAPYGIILRVASKENLHPCVSIVQKAFSDIGIVAPGEIVPGTSTDLVDIVVGHKL